MRSVKKFLITLLILLLIVVAAMVWVLMNFHLVNFRLFPKNVAELNLRGQEISVSTYEKLADPHPLGCALPERHRAGGYGRSDRGNPQR